MVPYEGCRRWGPHRWPLSLPFPKLPVAHSFPCTPRGSPTHRSGPLPSKIYSGHIPAGNDTQNGVQYGVHLWYMFIECTGVADPTQAPVVLVCVHRRLHPAGMQAATHPWGGHLPAHLPLA
jgi:hypothetical protein